MISNVTILPYKDVNFMRMMDKNLEIYLRATPTIDFDSDPVKNFVAQNSVKDAARLRQVVSLYYAVRDLIRYDPYLPTGDPGDFAASRTLQIKRGWCVTKSILYAACCRSIGIPARLGYADVRNHLSTENLRRVMGTDIFYWHGYTDVYLNDRWVKATPVFNIELCEKFRLKTLEFDGLEDSIYHPFDLDGRKHMEYLNFRGEYADLPFAEMTKDFARLYPRFTDSLEKANFEREVDRETGYDSSDQSDRQGDSR